MLLLYMIIVIIMIMFTNEVQFSSGLMEERIRYWNVKHAAAQAISILNQIKRQKNGEVMVPRTREELLEELYWYSDSDSYIITRTKKR